MKIDAVLMAAFSTAYSPAARTITAHPRVSYGTAGRDVPTIMREMRHDEEVDAAHSAIAHELARIVDIDFSKVKKQPPDLTAGEFNRSE